MIEERQHDWVTFNNDVIESVNQDQNLIYQLQNQLFISTILFNRSYNLIDRLSIICSTYFFDKRTSQNIYLFARQSSSTIVRAFFSLQSEKDSEIYAFVSQIDSFSSSLFRRLLNSISIRSSWNLLFLRSLLVVDISTVTLLSTFHILLRFRSLLRWSRYSLHVWRAISESEILFEISWNNSSLQNSHDRRRLFKRWLRFRFQLHAMLHLLVVIIQWILYIRIVKEAFSKCITLLARFTTSERSRVEDRNREDCWRENCWQVENRIFFCFARQIFEHIRREIDNLNELILIRFVR